MSFISIIALVLFLLALGSQILKLLKEKKADGVSYQAYLIGAVADAFIIFNSLSFEVQVLSLIHLILALITMSLIVYFQHKSKYQFKEKTMPFIFSSLCAFIMITGVSQALKTYSSMGRRTNVSFLNYFFQSINLSIMIYLEINWLVVVALSISLALHLYITFSTAYHTKNTTFDSRLM